MFDKILIANRGEIACRIARTCRRLGVRTVAVYSDADAQAQHVAACDEAWRLGPAPAAESYLNIERLLEVARQSGAQAIHPGYGFLSENAAFAEACERAGIVFIGPPAAAIRAMGSKSEAKALMAKAGVPLVPGYHGEDQDPARLAREAAAIGYPVLIKASAGGGGKGMRRVDRPEDFVAALASAKREAKAAFGDDRVLIERYLLTPRHIEVQVFADAHGNCVHLFERDCSIQRRHQKVLEEAPTPGMSAERRARMTAAAVAAARAIGYRGAGTVEFIADADGSFYFMEMNTRLQVEHPVTEMITGQDLVEWQLRVAAGEPLPLAQEQLTIRGHAIEARIYAEDPDNDFLPATGRIRHLRLPEVSAHVRIDTGVAQGDEVSVHYDPMIAKLIVWDADRAGALRRLRAALAEFQVVGSATNIAFLRRVAAHPAFAAGELDTQFIDRHRDALLPPRAAAPERVLAMAALAELLRIDAEARALARASGDPHSPWHATDGWMLNQDNHHRLQLRDGERAVEVIAHYRPGGFLLELPGGALRARGELDAGGRLEVDLDGLRLSATVVRDGADLTLLCADGSYRLSLYDPLAAAMAEEVKEGGLAAPMPGTIVAVLAQAGQRVSEGQPLLVLEAMKMEYTIAAPYDGLVESVHYAVGEQVSEGVELLSLQPVEKAS